jgi:DnaJ-class molecular chaperone
MNDSQRSAFRLALEVLGWDASDNDVAFIVKLAGTMGVDLSALTQALLREQVRREVAEHATGRKYKLGELLKKVTPDNTHTEQEAWGERKAPPGNGHSPGECANCKGTGEEWGGPLGRSCYTCDVCNGTGKVRA